MRVNAQRAWLPADGGGSLRVDHMLAEAGRAMVTSGGDANDIGDVGRRRALELLSNPAVMTPFRRHEVCYGDPRNV